MLLSDQTSPKGDGSAKAGGKGKGIGKDAQPAAKSEPKADDKGKGKGKGKGGDLTGTEQSAKGQVKQPLTKGVAFRRAISFLMDSLHRTERPHEADPCVGGRR
jgi:hypothetical protein